MRIRRLPVDNTVHKGALVDAQDVNSNANANANANGGLPEHRE